MGAIREFMDTNFRHFNARETVAAARAYEEHLAAGGEMLVTLAGAMSTAELGISLARMIRAGKVHAISCTGANLEEDVFNLVAHDEYETLPHWRGLSAEMERELYDRGMNRVTDTCDPRGRDARAGAPDDRALVARLRRRGAQDRAGVHDGAAPLGRPRARLPGRSRGLLADGGGPGRHPGVRARLGGLDDSATCSAPR